MSISCHANIEEASTISPYQRGAATWTVINWVVIGVMLLVSHLTTSSVPPRAALNSSCDKVYEITTLSSGAAEFLLTDSRTHRQEQSGWAAVACTSTLVLPKGTWQVQPRVDAEALCLSECLARLTLTGTTSKCLAYCNEPTSWPASESWEQRKVSAFFAVTCETEQCSFPLTFELNRQGSLLDALSFRIEAEKVQG